jgi:plastocyanin
MENVVVVDEVRPGASVWITPDGFDPENLYVAPHTRVTWTNRSGAPHTVTADEMFLGEPIFQSEQLDAERLDLEPEKLSRLGQRFSHPFARPGSFDYHSEFDGVSGAALRGTVHVGVPVEVRDVAFAPAMLDIPVGASVVWTNHDDAVHTVTAVDGTFDSGIAIPLAKGSRFGHTFMALGTFEYRCAIHPSMRGTIVVS